MIELDSSITNILDNLYEGVYTFDTNKLITYSNKSAEFLSGYTADEVLGKSCCSSALVHVSQGGVRLCQNLCPIANALKYGTIQESDAFIRHKEGYKVPVRVRVIPIRDSENVIIGAIKFFIDNSKKIFDNEKIDQLVNYSFSDPITNLPNRRFMEIKLSNMIEDTKKGDTPFNILLFEVQNLKHLNERYGDEAVDTLLKILSKDLSSSARSNLIIGRWSSNRFMVITPKINVNELLLISNKLKMLIDASSIDLEEGSVSINSICTGTKATHMDTLESIIKRLDNLLQLMKIENITIKFDENIDNNEQPRKNM